MRRSETNRIAVICTIAALVIVACADGNEDRGAGGGTSPNATEATLVLDFLPNAVHTGIYCARERGYFEEAGLELEIAEPSSTADTLKLIGQGKAAFGIADAIDVGQQIDRGLDAKAILAIVQRPLGGVITLEDSGIGSPADLEGKTVGITGVPSDEAVLDTVVADDGGEPSEVNRVTIGFNTLVALESDRVDAITGFPAADGTQLEVDGYAARSFALDEWGGPQYPGLVVFSNERRIAGNPELIRAFVAATVRGYEATLDDPDDCLDALLAQVPELDRKLATAQLDAYLPLFEAGAGQFGVLDPGSLEELSAFLLRNSLTDSSVGPERYGTNRFLAGE